MIRFTLALVAAFALMGAPAARADDDDDKITVTGCESIPMLGLDPYIRKICDSQIDPDGSWLRARQRVQPKYVRSSCGGTYYPGGKCPPWLTHDYTPEYFGDWEVYRLTFDTIPPGEPGHLDNPFRCNLMDVRCI